MTTNRWWLAKSDPFAKALVFAQLFILLLNSFTVLADFSAVEAQAPVPPRHHGYHAHPVAAPAHPPTHGHHDHHPKPHPPNAAPVHPPVHPPAHAPAPHHHQHHHTHPPSHAPAPHHHQHHHAQPPSHAPAPHHHQHHHAQPPSHAPAHSPHHHAPAQPPSKPPSHSAPPSKPPSHSAPPSKPPTHSPHHDAPAQPPTKPPTHSAPPSKPPTHSAPPSKPPTHSAPPSKPPTHAPAPVYPPKKHFPRSFVAVQGVVFCKSCKYSGVDNLLNATAIAGATVKLQCNNTKYPLVVKGTTDKNGYFFITAPKTITTYGAHKCKAFLVSTPTTACSKITNLHGGLTGAVLRPTKPFLSEKKLPFLLYTVGPFATESKCPR